MKALNAYMDWPRIEQVVYSEENHPSEFLGPHLVDGGLLIQCFFPTALKVEVVRSSKTPPIKMRRVDAAGFFAVLLEERKVYRYHYLVDGKPYPELFREERVIPDEVRHRFCHGVAYDIWRYLGAHPMKVHGVKGVLFAVWAPNALRVSVVGTFNGWDGRACPMNFDPDTGIHELFIPGLHEGRRYQYEIKLKNGLTYTKTDPYATCDTLQDSTVSKVFDPGSDFDWHDASYQAEHRDELMLYDTPISIYEISFSKWKEMHPAEQTYRDMADSLSSYVTNMGFTHVELMSVMEPVKDDSSGYQTASYYAPMRRYGLPEDFKYFVDTMHRHGIGVIMDWTPAAFPASNCGLSDFDGTCLYEHQDPRKGIHPVWGTRLFNYGRPEVTDFLIGNVFFWRTLYHIDGFRMDDISTMLRLDYRRAPGEWTPNEYGTAENTDGIEFLKHLNSVLKQKEPGVFMIAEESTSFPRVTGSAHEDSLGFDYKWNIGWTTDVMQYLSHDPAHRDQYHNELSFSMLYQYMDRFIIALARDAKPLEKEQYADQIAGGSIDAQIRLAHGYLMTYPGKKLISYGEKKDEVYLRDLLHLYRDYPALYCLDDEPDGFSWINHMDAEHCVFSYMRKTGVDRETLIVICNCSDRSYPIYSIGVPFAGSYKEISNSDARKYGGSGFTNSHKKKAKIKNCDMLDYTLSVRLAPFAVSMISYVEE